MVKRKWTPRELVLAGGFLILILAILTFYIWYQAEAVRLGMEISKLEDQAAKLKEEIKKLEARKAALLSLDRVEKIAREELGLSDPSEGQVLFEGFLPDRLGRQP